MILKTTQQTRNRRDLLQFTKGVYEKLAIYSKIANASLLRSGTEQEYLFLSFLFNNVLEVLAS